MKNFWLGFLVCALLAHFDAKACYDSIEYSMKRLDRLGQRNNKSNMEEREEVDAKIVGFKG
jgi:hypothetical protein